MKVLPKLVLVLSAAAACSVSAQTVYSGQADQARRERNREEALQNYRAGRPATTTTTTTYDTMPADRRSTTMREKTHNAAESVRSGTHKAANAARRVTHKSANAVRGAGHATASKAREVTDRTNAKFATRGKPHPNPEGINPAGMSSTAPTAPSAGTTK